MHADCTGSPGNPEIPDMNTTPIHPLIVHLPMALAVLMPLVAGGVFVAWWRGYFRKRTWSVVCLLQAAMLASSLVAMRTGESDEERVEQVVPEAAIERHEAAAQLFTWGSGLLLVVSLLPLLSRSPGRARAAGLVTLGGTLVVLGLGYKVGSAGGRLVYEHGAAAAFTATDQGAPSRPPASHGDDDRY
ncbi:hypothetical protein Pla86_13460 [Planctomycetes bacterium Pla86]|uniref:DUF2231 domain-containing protein n=1 Tax=Engelhardtia mirabilis TaxID=2528011 RepID=A0A518BH17_9BACT|nr:hypothetical protein Pla133_13470 [Planctomycetes bacterium Pla133]QDV00606.1 hypothetical protein Pla86_13460 [Planctomycetes bacterium Pla86]